MKTSLYFMRQQNEVEKNLGPHLFLVQSVIGVQRQRKLLTAFSSLLFSQKRSIIDV